MRTLIIWRFGAMAWWTHGRANWHVRVKRWQGMPGGQLRVQLGRVVMLGAYPVLGVGQSFVAHPGTPRYAGRHRRVA